MIAVFQKLGWFFREEWKRYSIAVVFLVINGVLEVLPPKLMGTSIDQIFAGSMTTTRLFLMIGLLLAIALSNYGVTYIWMKNLFGGSFLVSRKLRSNLMGQFLKMTPTFYEKNRTGDLMARATNDIQAVSLTAGFGILTLVDATVYLAVILLTMTVLISWKLTLICILPMPLAAYVLSKYGEMLHKRFMEAQDIFGKMNDQVLENISGVRVVRAYVQEEASRKSFREISEETYKKNLSVARIDSLFEPTMKLLNGISFLLGIGFGAYYVYHQEITIGDMISFNIYLAMLSWPMYAIGELVNIMQRGNASLDRVNETLAYEPDVQNEHNLVVVPMPSTISFQNVTFRYPSSEVDNLRDVTFELNRGQTLGIVGRTGSGKTTLMRQLLREYPLGKGEILISGTPMQKIAVEQAVGWLGYVPQGQILFSKTILQNIRFGKPTSSMADVEHALVMSAFQKDITYLPEGLDTMVGEKGVSLSGGQKQRVSIARALIADPEILLLDDALSAVDAKTETEIITHIRAERTGKTTWITTHRLSAVQHADLILVMDEGTIVERGTHDQLMKQNGWYKQQYERQQIEATLTDGE
ncbi:ABC transporter ATP-binding protein [Brevibacillus laterosporus]|uniref:ABC transporter ATP-binding protein n=1 Tax=Brevibacillus laterosporus TaxID=1465 RepID=UPI000E6BCFAF|nr:ABC transporter transmembrane domain-containing protein [Brevibacillus laterosporus]AYB40666.1 ATP-binding cassette domain-containing protein [Brevibacillus laterosporus]MBM7107132.1 putative multidrug resistance ABC transporter ATP-binding/permease protein YheI [Brevibacillus laterosporus]NKQ21983.1 ATP-binding cassette domain-containing protein [Brevibacillus laterosporus]WNX31118.1 ABC transporter transmembrane domain-containing protein [Brevibacillus laterosporus]